MNKTLLSLLLLLVIALLAIVVIFLFKYKKLNGQKDLNLEIPFSQEAITSSRDDLGNFYVDFSGTINKSVSKNIRGLYEFEVSVAINDNISVPITFLSPGFANGSGIKPSDSDGYTVGLIVFEGAELPFSGLSKDDYIKDFDSKEMTPGKKVSVKTRTNTSIDINGPFATNCLEPCKKMWKMIANGKYARGIRTFMEALDRNPESFRNQNTITLAPATSIIVLDE